MLIKLYSYKFKNKKNVESIPLISPSWDGSYSNSL